MMNKTKLAVAVLGLALAGVASAATITYNSTDVPKPILDLATATSVLTVPAGDWSARRTTTCDVNFAVRLRHTWDSDLVVELKGPSGTLLPLWKNLGGSSDNFNVRIDDEALVNISGAVNDGSSRRPQLFPGEALCWFDGPNPSGTWTLLITDVFGADVGTIDAWSIVVTAGPDGCTSCLPSTKGGGKGLGSSANNGGGNGDEGNPPPGQHGR